MNKHLAISLFFFLFSITLYAQLEAHLISGEGWAKGDFVEIGINEKGVFGAVSANKPATFHDNREPDGNGIFGFIANPLADGWMDYDGDYFTPGEPEEGFTIQFDGVNYSNNNLFGTFQIAGEVTEVKIISSDCFEDTSQISWEGNINGLRIRRYYSISKEGLFIQMRTFISNLSPTAVSNVYFMHNVDPDNNVGLSGSYETDNEIISQASSATDNISLVKASQDAIGTALDMDGSHVSLFSSDERARVTYGGFSNRNAQQIWDGTGADIVNTEGSLNTFVDEAISLAFSIGNINAGETKQFTYYYILEEVDESFIPLIVNAFQENPTECDGTDGKIVFSGLTTGETYTVNYEDDGVFVPNENYVANENGEIELINLNAGVYTNLNISFSGCSTNINSDFTLLDPFAPNYNINSQDFTNCASIDGELIFSNLTPSTNYLVEYTFDGTQIGPQELTADINGDIIIDNLSGGVYTDFVLEQFDCSTANNQIITISGPENPMSYPIDNQEYCDDDYDYITNIDLTVFDSSIIGTDIASAFEITYHATEQDAIDGINLSAANYNTTGEATYTLYAKKTNATTECFSYTTFNITINLPPFIDINEAFICVNSDDTINTDYNPPILDTGLSNATHEFLWYFEGEIINGETSNTLVVSNFGDYSVSATVIDTGCSYTQNLTVLPSGPPQELDVIISSPPFSENHTVEIIASGFGNYVYSVDNQPIQNSPYFYNLSNGVHNFYITDINGCGTVVVEKTIIDYMNFFTPNDDDRNDYWQIIGVKELVNPEIFIFDRFGKLVTVLSQNSKGWDGNYNNKPMPASDYWFKIRFKDDRNITREYTNHFTLRR